MVARAPQSNMPGSAQWQMTKQVALLARLLYVQPTERGWHRLYCLDLRTSATVEVDTRYAYVYDGLQKSHGGIDLRFCTWLLNAVPTHLLWSMGNLLWDLRRFLMPTRASCLGDQSNLPWSIGHFPAVAHIKLPHDQGKCVGTVFDHAVLARGRLPRGAQSTDRV